jgi:hypothetical protein
MNEHEGRAMKFGFGRGPKALGVVAVLVLPGGGVWLHGHGEAPAAAAPRPAPPAVPATALPTPPQAPPPAAQAHGVAAGEPPAVAAWAAALPASQAEAPAPSSQDERTVAEWRDIVATAFGPYSLPEHSLRAARVLSACTFAPQLVEGLTAARGAADIVPPQERLTGPTNDQQLADAKRTQRLCKVFDNATLSREGELLQKAHEGGAQDATLPYLQWLTLGDGRNAASAAQIAALQAELRRSAEAGDEPMLMQYALSHGTDGSRMGASPVQHRAYREAYLLILEEQRPGLSAGFREHLDRVTQWLPPQPGLTAAQQREAEALAQQLVEAWRRAHGKGG